MSNAKKYLKNLWICALAFMLIGCGDVTQDSTYPDLAEINQEQTENIQDTSQDAVVYVADDAAEDAGGQEAISSESNGEKTLEMQLLDVHQGLCVLINCDGHYMLYDGGGRSRSSFVVSYLKGMNIDSFDYIVASHYDEDHIAGLVGVMKNFGVDNLICPDYETDTKIYNSFINAIPNETTVIHPISGASYDLAGTTIKILACEQYVDDDNQHSIVVKVSLGDEDILITGDADEDVEADIVRSKQDIDSEIYIAGHHGSKYSSSSSFLAKVSPECVLISCGEDNSYGHPHSEMLERVQKTNAKVYRTDKQGTITMTTDGESCEFSTKPWDIVIEEQGMDSSNSQSATTNSSGYNTTSDLSQNTDSSYSEDTSSTEEYVLNTNTKKIHHSYCRSVKTIKDKNKAFSNKSLSELMSQGYDKCKNCF